MKTRRIPLVFLLCLVFAPAPLGAQEPAPAPEPAEPTEPKEITSADFAIEASAVEERLSRIEVEISVIDVADEVDAALDSIQAEGQDLESTIDDAVTRRALSAELNTMRLALDTLKGRVKRQIDKLGVYSGKLEELATQNQEDIERWTRALREVQRSGTPDEVKQRTASILRGLRAGSRELEKKIEELLVLQSKALDVRDSTDALLQAVAVAQREQADALYERQDPPLWKIGTAGDKERLGYGVSLSASTLVETLRREWGLLLLEIVLVIFLGWLFSWAKNVLSSRLAKRQDEAAQEWEEQATAALRHPWAAAALVTLASVRLLHPDRVVEVILFTWVLVLPLWFVILKEMVPPAFRTVLAGLGLLATLQIGVTLVAGRTEFERVLLLVELVGFCVGSLWYIRIRRQAKHARGAFWLGAVDLLARLGLLAAAVGVVAGVLGYTYLATDLALATTIGTIVATAWMALSRIVEALVSTAVHDRRLDAFRMVRANRDTVGKTLRRLTRLAALGLFAWSIADVTSVWRPVGGALGRFLSADLGFGFATLDLTVADLFGFFFVLWLSWMFARLVSFVLQEEFFPRLEMKQGLPYALTAFTRYAIIAIGFIAAMAILGVSLDRLTIILSALGVGIGFGLQNIVNNVVSGFILLTERPVRVRDKVEVDDILGTVSGIGIRASSIRTFDGAEVIVPNSDLTSKQVINWTLSERRQRVTIPIGVAYGTDPNRVLDLLRAVAASHEKVFQHPPPLALFRGFGESSLEFELRIFMDPSDVLDVPSEVRVEVSRALGNAGIRIPFPQRDVHVKSLSEAPREPVADHPDDPEGSPPKKEAP